MLKRLRREFVDRISVAKKDGCWVRISCDGSECGKIFVNGFPELKIMCYVIDIAKQD
jgi:hypothetical protein